MSAWIGGAPRPQRRRRRCRAVWSLAYAVHRWETASEGPSPGQVTELAGAVPHNRNGGLPRRQPRVASEAPRSLHEARNRSVAAGSMQRTRAGSATSCMPRRRAQSAAVLPFLFLAAGSAPATSSSSTISHRLTLIVRQPPERRDSLARPTICARRGILRQISCASDRRSRGNKASIFRECIGSEAPPSPCGRRARPSRSGRHRRWTRAHPGRRRARGGTSRPQRVARRGLVQRTLAGLVLHLERKAEVEEQREDVTAGRASPPRTSRNGDCRYSGCAASSCRARSRSSRKHASRNCSRSSRAAVDRVAP